MNKKYLILAIAAIILLLGTGFFIFTKGETTLNSSIAANEGDLVLKNTSKANLKIITKDSAKIEISLVGPADQLKNVYFSKNADGPSEFSIPENSKGIKGTITVPQGVKIIDLDLPQGVNFVVNNPDGSNAPGSPNNRSLWNSRGGGDASGNNGNTPGNNSGNGDKDGDNGEDDGNGDNGGGDNGGNPPNPPSNPNPPNPPGNPNPPAPPNSPVCGNGILETGEQCDDGNRVSQDGCSYYCLADTRLAVCGNGAIEPGEQCDDGNRISADGCSSDCRLEFPSSVCGNLVLEAGEQCDDGNRVSGDGCSYSCQSESYSAVCGNGVLEGGEQCDDGNRVSADGCSAICNLENAIYTECTIQLRQEERNLCCQEVNINTPHEECTGYWLFNYNTRLCYWHCPQINCSLPTTPALKNSCCATQNKDKPTPPCAGDWIFDNAKNVCSYECTNFNSTGEHTSQEIDETTQYCKNTYTDQNDINKCCDDFLKHPLSLGPHPGYPDCIGRWSIKPGTNTCQFDCVSYEEMTEILKQLEEDSNNEQ